MGKKPVLGIVSAFCVGLALTGCRDANTRSDSPPMIGKENGPAYQPHPAFGSAASGTASQPNGWNAPPTAGKNGVGMAGATTADATPMPSMSGPGAKPIDPAASAMTNSSGVQPAGGLMSGPLSPPAPPAPPGPDASPMQGPALDPTPASGPTSSNFPPLGDVRSVSGRVLPPTPALTPTATTLPPLAEMQTPPLPGPALDTVPPPPPQSLPIPKSPLPQDMTPTPAAAPMPQSSTPAPLIGAPLPPPLPPPLPAPPG